MSDIALTNVGQGNGMRKNDDSGEQWILLDSPRGKILLVEYWRSAHYDSTEMSSEDASLTRDELIRISEDVGDLWSDEAPRLDDYVHFDNFIRF